MPAVAPQDRELILRQLLRLVDLSRDVDRANDDRAFVANDGEIIYVVDQNIFEMFVRPFKHQEAVETFYAGDVWAYKDETAVDAWRDFEVQAAMVASETLLMQTLPGARSPFLLMTEPHRWELASRVENLLQELTELIEQRQDKVKELLQLKYNLIADLGGVGQRHAEVPKSDDETLEADLAKLSNDAARDRVRIARRASEILAADHLTEPLEQLRRVTVWPIRTRLRAMPTIVDFKPSQKELELIEKQAEQWFAWIVRELKLPGHAKRPRAQNPQDSAKAMWNDARSIAYLRWVSNNRLTPNQRVVLVTGDIVLFDAYRRWHVGLQPEDPQASTEPFLLRRATQYSPIFNPNDSASDLRAAGPDRNDLFSRIEQAIEGALLPIMLADEKKRAKEKENADFVHGGAAHRREVLALKLAGGDQNLAKDKDLGEFSEHMSDHWLKQRRDKIVEIRNMWQEALRVSLGASYDIFKQRMLPGKPNPDFVKALEAAHAVASRDLTAAASAMALYVGDLLGRLADDTAQLWLPLASNFITDPPKPGQARRFTPMIAEYAPPLGGSGTDHAAPESIFANAAARALEVQDVNNANRFAGLALRADGASRRNGEGAPNYEKELEYLHAVTYRFQIGAVGDHYRHSARSANGRRDAWRSINEAKGYYARASRLVDQCMTMHFNAARKEENGSLHHRLRYLRALSERAALNLFMACALGMSRTPDRDTLNDEARRYLNTARGDLWLCWQKKDEYAFEEERSLYDRVRVQFTANIAAAEAINVVLTRNPNLKLEKKLDGVIGDVQKILLDAEPRLPLLRAELWTFLVLANKRVMGIGKLEARLDDDLPLLKLPLDKELYRRLAPYA